GDDVIVDDFGDDVITGGRGNDHIVVENKSNGNDTIIFNRGDGKDIVEGAFNTDTLRLGPGILPSDIIIARSVFHVDPFNPQFDLSGDLVIRIAGTGDEITFRNAYIQFVGLAN